jgi:hypothetical protein
MFEVKKYGQDSGITTFGVWDINKKEWLKDDSDTVVQKPAISALKEDILLATRRECHSMPGEISADTRSPAQSLEGGTFVSECIVEAHEIEMHFDEWLKTHYVK